MIERIRPRLEVEKLGEIIEPMVMMIAKLPPLSGYKTLIGDDVSARIPALIMRRVINHFRLKQDLPKVRTVFVVGGEFLKREIVDQRQAFFSENGCRWGKTLYLTEYVESGMGTTQMAKSLGEAGVDYDLAAISIAFNPMNSPLSIVDRLFFGEIGHLGAVLHHDVKVAGVTKYNHISTWQISQTRGWPFGLCVRRLQGGNSGGGDVWSNEEMVRWGNQVEIKNRLAHAVIDDYTRYSKPNGDKKNLFIKARKDVNTIADHIVSRLNQSG